MNGCREIRDSITEYLDGRLTGRAMQEIAAHLNGCRECALECRLMEDTQRSLASLGPVPEPPDMLLRIRVAVSHEMARSHRSRWAGLGLVWKNTLGPFLLQASAGFASAVLLLGTVVFLVTMFTQPVAVEASKDEPLGKASAPRLLYLSSPAVGDQINASATPVVVEAYVNGAGQVYDYRIISGPTDADTRSEVENMLLFSVFEPARFFGQPVRGLAVLSFAGVAVRG
jgi:anti-sigma factor RsiW